MTNITTEQIRNNAITALKIAALQIAESHLEDNAVSVAKMNINANIDMTSTYTLINLPTPTDDYHPATKKYIDDEITALGTSIDWLPSVLDRYDPTSGLPTDNPGDRYLATATANGWTINYIYEGTGSGWTETVPQTGQYLAVDDETDGIYHYGGGTWNKKQFENTVAGTGLTRSTDTVHIGSGATGDLNGINRAADDISVAVDNVGIELSSNKVQLKDLGVVTGKINNDAVTKEKINADVAGIGLVQNVDGSLEVNPDGATLENSGDTVRIKDNGVTAAKINADAVTAVKINADVAGAGLTQNGGTGALEIDFTKQIIREIPNEAPDDARVAFTVDNTIITGSEHVYVNGILQDEGGSNDYTISGNTITFTYAPTSTSKIRVSYRKA